MRLRTIITKASIGGSVLVGTLAWLLGLALVMVPAGGDASSIDNTSVLAPYGTRGAHAVGVRNLTDAASLQELAVWYPAVPAKRDPVITYTYAFKMFGPFGSVAPAESCQTSSAPIPAGTAITPTRSSATTQQRFCWPNSHRTKTQLQPFWPVALPSPEKAIANTAIRPPGRKHP